MCDNASTDGDNGNRSGHCHPLDLKQKSQRKHTRKKDENTDKDATRYHDTKDKDANATKGADGHGHANNIRRAVQKYQQYTHCINTTTCTRTEPI